MKQLIYAADDEKDILEVIEGFLENAGFDVCTFSTGDALYEAFREKPCDLVVLDIMMPGRDGCSHSHTDCKGERDRPYARFHARRR